MTTLESLPSLNQLLAGLTIDMEFLGYPAIF